ncbi:hypothetical protein PSZ77_24105, partial [Shigella sonnei]|nr:hypothetical protein [Shigella sonnei]
SRQGTGNNHASDNTSEQIYMLSLSVPLLGWCYHWHGCSPSPVWQYWNNSRQGTGNNHASDNTSEQIYMLSLSV